MNQSKKRILCLLAVVCLLAFCTYTFRSGILTEHDCSGEHCTACLRLSCWEALAGLCLLSACVAFLVTVPSLSAKASDSVGMLFGACWTPVFLKVKLSD